MVGKKILGKMILKGSTEFGSSLGETIIGTSGNNKLLGYGGDKEDNAIYSGKKDHYLIIEDNHYLIPEDNGIVIFQDLRESIPTPDCTDYLKNIEFIKFVDQVLPRNKHLLTGQAFNLHIDEEISALDEGLMVIRKLFGTAFDGDKLTAQAISNDASTTIDEIREYIAAMSNVDNIA